MTCGRENAATVASTSKTRGPDCYLAAALAASLRCLEKVTTLATPAGRAIVQGALLFMRSLLRIRYVLSVCASLTVNEPTLVVFLFMKKEKKRKEFGKGAEGRVAIDGTAPNFGGGDVPYSPVASAWAGMLPSGQVIQPAPQEYPGGREERLRSEDRVGLTSGSVQDGRGRSGSRRFHRARKAELPEMQVLASGGPYLHMGPGERIVSEGDAEREEKYVRSPRFGKDVD
ncbi:hypothetical protein EDB84DRAFT_1616215 [Lactarius hengduanensis]|nr:hypothetical protein EDB84DRAFT_1616215 [Lactarius hengduanensis]